MKTNKISTKVKILGALLIIATFSTITITLYLNKQNKSDGLLVNIAGKQRMLSQKIAKDIFYMQATGKQNITGLQNTVNSFEKGLITLQKGNSSLQIPAAPTREIDGQLRIVQNLWNAYKKDVDTFIQAITQNNTKKQRKAFDAIAQANEKLLAQMDKAVDMYSDYTANKTEFIQMFQYGAFVVLFSLVAFSIIKLKRIETHVNEFLQRSKRLMQGGINTPIEPMDLAAESEIQEVAATLNQFIIKINSTMDLSSSALRQSKQASDKLEELSEDFNSIIAELGGDEAIGESIDKSEDIMIQSSEEMVQTNKRLLELKAELDKVLKLFEQEHKA